MVEPSRIAFVTIGQTPRIDLVPEMMSEIEAGLPANSVTYEEFGVLDGLMGTDLDALRASSGEHSFATRLANGEEIVTSKPRTEERLNALLNEIDDKGFDLIVLLCTGTKIEPLKNTLVVEAQRLVDSTIEALAASAGQLGLILPLERQIDDFHERHILPGAPKLVAASPYAEGDIEAQAAKLADCDLIVMHCMGYSSAMHETARRAAKTPVLLSRRLVANVVRQML